VITPSQSTANVYVWVEVTPRVQPGPAVHVYPIVYVAVAAGADAPAGIVVDASVNVAKAGRSAVRIRRFI
jgi:hypothetical protein